MNKGDRTYHLVGHSDLNKLYINDFFERKQIIEDLEAELTVLLKETSNTDNLAVSEEAIVDVAITSGAKASNNMEIYLKDKQETGDYE